MSEEQAARIVAFVEARIADDERIARDAATGTSWGGMKTGPEWVALRGAVEDAESGGTIVHDEGMPTSAQAEHIARHDPARALRDVAAKRLLFAKQAPVIDGTQSSWTWFEGSESEPEKVMQVLALPYADHPDYDPTWAPK